MTVRTAVLGIVALSLGCAPPQSWDPTVPPGSPDPGNPFIQQRGTRLVDGAGNDLTLRAVNVGGWLLWEGWMWGGSIQPEQAMVTRLRDLLGDEETRLFTERVQDHFITDADLAAIAALGFNAIRVPFNYRLFEDDAQPFVYKPRAFELLDRLIDQCEAHGLVALLDLHSTPGGQAPFFMSDPGPTSLWASQAFQDRTVALWRAIAERYRDRPGVGAYDLINEPYPPEGHQLFDLYRRIAASIREVDPNHLIIVEGQNFAGDFSLFTAPVTFNQAYSFHQYVWAGDSRQEEIDAYRRLSELHDIPMWNGEFGVNSVEMNGSSRDLYMEPANGLVGFGYWSWKVTPQDQPHLIGITAEMPNWYRLIDWIAGPPWATRPTLEEARLGMDEFIEGMAFERCEENPEMAAALGGVE